MRSPKSGVKEEVEEVGSGEGEGAPGVEVESSKVFGAMGGQVVTGARVVKVEHEGGRVSAVEVEMGGEVKRVKCGQVISSMPLSVLVRQLVPAPPAKPLWPQPKHAALHDI